MDNVAFFNPLNTAQQDDLQQTTTNMDQCLLSTTSDGVMKYHTLSGCLKSQGSKTKVPKLCKDVDADACRRQPTTYASKKYSFLDLPYQTAVGLAKDGHIIVGPYNKDGELWSCEQHDVCNGVFLADNSYAYATTYTFPYVVGCWGPGPI